MTITPDITPEPTPTPLDLPHPTAPVEPDTSAEPKVYSEEFVGSLRDEMARKRIAAREREDAANRRLVTMYAKTDGRLVDDEALVLSDELLGEDGLVDPEKVGQAIGALVEAKPYLAARRPTAALPLGVQQPAPDTPGLFGIIKRTTG